MSFLKSLSMERKSLRYKLMIAFSLMSIIPLLVIVYFVTNYIFPNIDNLLEVTVVVLLTLWLSWLGYLLIRQIINPVIDLALETKLIAEGRFGSKVALEREDELGDIASAVNTMTTKIRNYIGELQDYSKKTAALNIQIHKKVITLTNLMQLGDLISAGSGFDDIAKFSTERISDELEGAFCAIIIRQKSGNYIMKAYNNNTGKDIPLGDLENKLPSFEKYFAKNEYIAIDAKPPQKSWLIELKKNIPLENVLLYPMRLEQKNVGVILLGNFSRGYEFTDEIVGIVRAYEKELILAYHSTRVFERVKSLEVVDTLTGLYSRGYLEERLQDEINRAVFYQRPCSLLVITIDNFEKYSDHYGVPKAKQVLKMVAHMLSTIMSPVGKGARFDYDEFGVLLPEKNKRESIAVAEDIRERIENMEISADPYDKITVSIGVGENPIDGTNAKEIIAKAYHNLERAKEEGHNRVVGE
ncbi:MAG: diguanylate cyclase [Candidatus Omnitrophica bacterium]|nr:diguanylate cyclase [Candidatus Omnitrophota bacterium]